MTNLPNKTRSDEEAKTITMMTEFRQNCEDSAGVVVANVFECQWSSSLSVEKVIAIAEAIYGITNMDVQSVLTAMCRKKILRSRMYGGKRFYEVNY
jgi:hypothetical protein